MSARFRTLVCDDFFLNYGVCDRIAYIEENLKIRGRPRDDEEKDKKPADPQEALYRIVDKFKVNKEGQTKGEEGSVTNSLTMLTAIPEVDLGME